MASLADYTHVASIVICGVTTAIVFTSYYVYKKQLEYDIVEFTEENSKLKKKMKP